MDSPNRGQTAWEVAVSGTYADAKAPRAVAACFLALSLVLVLLPAVGMAWARTDTTNEARELAEAPQLVDADGSPNLAFLADAGAYLDDHFAYRDVALTVNARIRALLGTSATDQVVVGDDGWLYYGGTLPDYLGQAALSDRALRNIAHNLALAQDYVEAQRARFAFVIAPNKNSLYPQHMPYYYLETPEERNAQRLVPYLEEEGVRFVDLFSLFDGLDEERYLLRDSHWDNLGALLASNAIADALGMEPFDIDAGAAFARTDFEGDLEAMLYPAGGSREDNWYFEGVNDEAGMAGEAWSYVEGASVTDSWSRTASAGREQGVLMFRDSFGNALVPLWASQFSSAAFSKLVPYNVANMALVGDGGADAVVIERAERHLSYLASNPPIVESPAVELGERLGDGAGGAGGERRARMEAALDGPYWKVEGALDEGAAGPESALFVRVVTAAGMEGTFDAAWKTIGGDGAANDYGYQVYLPAAEWDLNGATVEVYAGDADGPVECVGSFPVGQ